MAWRTNGWSNSPTLMQSFKFKSPPKAPHVLYLGVGLDIDRCINSKRKLKGGAQTAPKCPSSSAKSMEAGM